MIESGKRVKFIAKFIKKEAPIDRNLDELIHWCKELNKAGLMPTYLEDGKSTGNLSYRVKDGFIITASGLETKKNLTNGSFVKIPFHENKHLVDLCEKLWNGVRERTKSLEVRCIGSKEPSSETILHLAIYHFRKDVNAIVHGHGEEILKTASKRGVVETEREDEFGTIDLVESVLKVLKNNRKTNFFILKNHGFVSLGKSLEEAGKSAIEFQKF